MARQLHPRSGNVGTPLSLALLAIPPQLIEGRSGSDWRVGLDPSHAHCMHQLDNFLMLAFGGNEAALWFRSK